MLTFLLHRDRVYAYRSRHGKTALNRAWSVALKTGPSDTIFCETRCNLLRKSRAGSKRVKMNTTRHVLKHRSPLENALLQRFQGKSTTTTRQVLTLASKARTKKITVQKGTCCHAPLEPFKNAPKKLDAPCFGISKSSKKRSIPGVSRHADAQHQPCFEAQNEPELNTIFIPAPRKLASHATKPLPKF